MILNNENYFSAEANKLYMSISEFKNFQRCPALAMAKLRGEWQQEKTTALLVGSYVDSHFEGTLDIFRAQNPEIFMKNGNLKADYRRAEDIICRIESDDLFMQYMSGQKQVVCTGELFGTPWKIKIDSLLPDKIVDLKVMRSMDRVMGISFVEYWQYDFQMAVYSEIHGEGLETYLAVGTKEDPPNLEIIHIPEWRRDECLRVIERDMPEILAVKRGEIEPERCGVCEYCRATKILTEPIDFEIVGYSTKQLKAMEGLI